MTYVTSSSFVAGAIARGAVGVSASVGAAVGSDGAVGRTVAGTFVASVVTVGCGDMGVVRCAEGAQLANRPMTTIIRRTEIFLHSFMLFSSRRFVLRPHRFGVVKAQ